MSSILDRQKSIPGKIPSKKVKRAILAFDKAVLDILSNADEIHLKGLFSLKMKPKVRKIVMERGKSFVFNRKQFAKGTKKMYMRNLRKRRKAELST